MKLNFWQILGVALLIAGAAWWIYSKKDHATDSPANNGHPAPAIVKPATTTAPAATLPK